MSRVLHRWRTIHLNQPRFHLSIYHEIIPKYFKGVFPWDYHIAHRLDRLAHNLVHSILDQRKTVFSRQLFDCCCQFFLKIHVAFYLIVIKVLRILSNWIVSQMWKPIFDVWRRVFFGWKPHITLFVCPNSKGLKICNNDPLSDIKLYA